MEYENIVVSYKMDKDDENIYLVHYRLVGLKFSGNFVVFDCDNTLTFSNMDLIEMIDHKPSKEKIARAKNGN